MVLIIRWKDGKLGKVWRVTFHPRIVTSYILANRRRSRGQRKHNRKATLAEFWLSYVKNKAGREAQGFENL